MSLYVNASQCHLLFALFTSAVTSLYVNAVGYNADRAPGRVTVLKCNILKYSCLNCIIPEIEKYKMFMSILSELDCSVFEILSNSAPLPNSFSNWLSATNYIVMHNFPSTLLCVQGKYYCLS